MLFNYLTEAFHENELCDLFIQYSDVFCLSNKFIVAQYRYVSRVWNIQRALNFMEMHLIDKIQPSVSFFFPLSLSLSLPLSSLFVSFVYGGKKRANNGAYFHTGQSKSFSSLPSILLHYIYICRKKNEYLITFLDLSHTSKMNARYTSVQRDIRPQRGRESRQCEICNIGTQAATFITPSFHSRMTTRNRNV